MEGTLIDSLENMNDSHLTEDGNYVVGQPLETTQRKNDGEGDPPPADTPEQKEAKALALLSDEDKVKFQKASPEDKQKVIKALTEDGDEEEEEEEEEEAELDAEGKPIVKAPVKIIPTLKETLGFDTETEYPDSAEGLEAFSNDYIAETLDTAVEQKFKETLEQKPALDILNQFIDAGYTVEDYADFVAGSQNENLVLDDNTPKDTLKEVIRTSMRSQGTPDSIIAATLEIEDKLLENAKSLQTTRVNSRKAFFAQVEQKLNASTAIRQARTKQLGQEMSAALIKGKLGPVTLTPSDKQKLIAFRQVKDETGKTGRQKKFEALTGGQQLLLDYLVMNDFKMDGLSKGKTNQINGNTFDEILSSSRMAGGNSKGKPPVQRMSKALNLLNKIGNQ